MSPAAARAAGVECDATAHAVEIAAKALQKIESHEKFCGEREERTRAAWERMERKLDSQRDEFNDAIKDVHQRIDVLGGKWLAVAGGVVAMLLAILGYVLTQGVPWR